MICNLNFSAETLTTLGGNMPLLNQPTGSCHNRHCHLRVSSQSMPQQNSTSLFHDACQTLYTLSRSLPLGNRTPKALLITAGSFSTRFIDPSEFHGDDKAGQVREGTKKGIRWYFLLGSGSWAYVVFPEDLLIVSLCFKASEDVTFLLFSWSLADQWLQANGRVGLCQTVCCHNRSQDGNRDKGATPIGPYVNNNRVYCHQSLLGSTDSTSYTIAPLVLRFRYPEDIY